MTVDQKSYDFAQIWLAHHGYTWTGDIQAFAERIQETAEEFVMELNDKEYRHAD